MVSRVMHRKQDVMYISKYELIKAFFKTEDDDDFDMAIELNRMINEFCQMEQKMKSNIVELPFSQTDYEKAINYISSAINDD